MHAYVELLIIYAIYMCVHERAEEMSRTQKHRLREGDAGLVIQGTCRQFSELRVFPSNVITSAAVQRPTQLHSVTWCTWFYRYMRTKSNQTLSLNSFAKLKKGYQFECKKYEKSHLLVIVKYSQILLN